MEEKQTINKQSIDSGNSPLEGPTINDLQTGSIIIPQQQESIEVTRNTKGYNYVVKILGTDLNRLKELTDKLNILYPNDK